MGKELYDNVVSKIALVAPMFAKVIVDIGLEKFGVTSYEVTPFQMKKILREEIFPKLKKYVKITDTFETIGGGEIIFNKERKVISINTFARRLIGLESEISLDDERMLGIIDKLNLKHSIDTILKQKSEVIISEIKLEEPNVRLNIIGGSIKDEQDEVKGVIFFLQDITLRTALETEIDYVYDRLELKKAELEEEKASLEIKVKERTKELQATMEELRQANEEQRKKADELEKAYKELKKIQDKLVRNEKLAALGKLAGAVGHELRNPLGVIRNSVFFLKMKLDKTLADEKIKKHLAILDEEVNTSDRIITDILAFGRVKEPQVAKININDVVKESISKSKLEMPENIELNIQLKSNLPEVLVDSAQIQQVFSNIILNAVQAMPKGGNLIITSIKKDKFIEVNITDTGEGIPKENLDKIFEPLFSTKVQGTGLGLSVCQSIIENHEGSIEVESEVGKGTKFIVKLPIR